MPASDRDFAEAVELAQEAMAYVPDYFLEKWDMAARWLALREKVTPEAAPYTGGSSGSMSEFEHVDVPAWTPVSITVHGEIHSQVEWEAWAELVEQIERAALDRRLSGLDLEVE